MKLLLDSRVNKEKKVNLNERGVICLVNTHNVHFVLGVIFISVQSPLIGVLAWCYGFSLSV